MNHSAILALENGCVFHGCSIGAPGSSVGEVVFNTAMTGYQEILTDPSYASQIITLTCPHIGNVGTNGEDAESDRVFGAGLVIRHLPASHSNWRSTDSLSSYLAARNVVAISDIDTRHLTRRLRSEGAMAGCIMAGADVDPDRALALARAFPGLAGMDLAREVTASAPWRWNQGTADGAWTPQGGHAHAPKPRFRVVACDYGVKHTILRLLAGRGCEVMVVPAQTGARDILKLDPDGVFLSNGPGDPEPCTYAIETIRDLAAYGMPMFGICLGHQLLALASGARTHKMKTGHHGANHPVQDLASGQVLITSQNHGFTVADESLPDSLRVTHRSLFDGTIQGIERLDCPAYAFQGHPEASPGPRDMHGLFDRFISMMDVTA